MDYWVNKKEKLKATKLLRQIEEMANASIWELDSDVISCSARLC